MNAISLTPAQTATLAPLQVTLAAAVVAYRAAYAALQTQLAVVATAASVTAKHPRHSLSDDGKSLIVS